ncbi:MAG: MBOAT family O-acyltransferase [Bacteroidota bacterium]
MVFASLFFLFVFLPLNLILYYSSKNPVYRNALLTLFSLWFYAWGEPVWIVLLLFSAVVDWGNGIFIEKYRGTQWARLGLVSSAIVNLGLLVIFKYSAFIYENLNALFGLNLEVPHFALPIGISFYSFQTLSYVIDVYRGEVKAQRSYGKFLLFVSLYHQLVAGPIVRYAHIAHEIDNRKFDIRDISEGISRFCFGLFKKICIANVAGELVAKYLDGDMGSLSVMGGWFGIIMFTLQIYFDFSGYSDMAIGLGKMFGFHYHENFNYPYTARSATDFWRRWHISLGSFFRDYLYIPLGGNRSNMYRNLFIVWFLTGLWHGASWNFIFWGLYFGILIALERMFLQKVLDALPRVVSHLYLLSAAVLGWALFYFTDLGRLGEFLSIIFGASGHAYWDLATVIVLKEHVFWLIFSVIICMPVYHVVMNWIRKRMTEDSAVYYRYAFMSVDFVILFMTTAMLVGRSYNPFLYYRF